MLRKSLWLPRQQPNFPVEIDRGNPLVRAAALKHVWSGADAGRNAMSGVHGTLTSGATVATTNRGRAFSLDGVDDFISFGNVRDLETSTGRLVAFARVQRTWGLVDFSGILNSGKNSSNDGGWMIVGTSTNRIRFYVRNTTTTWVFAETAVINEKQWYDVCATWDSANIRVYLDGVLQATTACNSISYPGTVSQPANIGRYSTDEWPGYVALAGFGDGFLASGPVAMLAQDPYQIFRPKSRRIWVPVSAGGATLSGDAATTSAAAGSLSTSIPLAGAALGVSAASGQISTAIPLGGNAASVSVAGGVLSALIQLGGAAVATAAAAADLTAGGGLSGAAQALASGSADLTIQIRLSGAALSQALATGGLTTGAGLSGAALGQASASGALTTGIPLTGAALMVASASGNVTTIVQMAGVAASVSSAIGSLDVAIRLNGAAVSQALAGGDLTARIQFDGAAVAQAAASGALSAVSSAPTPIERTLRVAAESRTLRVAAESRTLRVAA